jgi:hypothetical protein
MQFTAKTGIRMQGGLAWLQYMLVMTGSLMCCLAVSPAGYAGQGQQEARDFRSLDREIQVLKREVLELNRDLRLLEEEVLYPADRQLVVFISLGDKSVSRIDRATLSLGGQVLVSHEYSAGESSALRQGGVHRLYEGSLQSGAHYVEVDVAGLGDDGEIFTASILAKIVKRADPRFIELQLVSGDEGTSPVITVQGW